MKVFEKSFPNIKNKTIPAIEVTNLKNSPRPDCIDEIVANNCNIHIEKMDDAHFWMNISVGDECFVFSFKGIATIKQKPVSIDLTREA